MHQPLTALRGLCLPLALGTAASNSVDQPREDASLFYLSTRRETIKPGKLYGTKAFLNGIVPLWEKKKKKEVIFLQPVFTK